MPKRLLALLACALLAIMPLAGCSSAAELLSEKLYSQAGGVSIRAERGSGTLEITRPEPQGEKPDVEADSWTIFVYLCGSDLESDGGSASGDLDEMQEVAGDENVRIVVQAGGAYSWKTSSISKKGSERMVIEEGGVEVIDSKANRNMGDPDTLKDFLSWGIKEYPAEHMAVILWNHGGGSIGGVCFDEVEDYDSLTLQELNTALSGAFENMWDKFEFIGFDACLMSTIETANITASYAKYLVASPESEPATGWDYTAIMDKLNENPKADGLEIGRAICDSYMASLENSWDEEDATLSVVDLSRIDDLLQNFYHFSQELYEASEDQPTLANAVRGINNAEFYGTKSANAGYTNMVDLGGLVDACEEMAPSTDDANKAIADAVVYKRVGSAHKNSSGLSVYYPFKIMDPEELTIFGTVAVNPSYLAFVDRLVHGGTYNGGSEYEDYDDSGWFGGDGFWNFILTGLGAEEEEYWDYVDEHEDESQLISFANKPTLDSDGTYWFKLDKDGIENATAVSGIVFMLSEDGEDLLLIGETYDVYGDWDDGTFYDGFDGNWLSLPDGQNLSIEVADATNDDYIVYSSTIRLNGEDTNLMLKQYYSDDHVEVLGTWDGMEEWGAADRGVKPLKKGDVIVPIYGAYAVESEDEFVYRGHDFKVTDDLKVNYGPLDPGTYTYSFSIDDVFGDYYMSDAVLFIVEQDGSVSFMQE